MSTYNRNTELRNVHTKDLYNLAVILDDENYWQILMEIIPQEINNQTFGTKEDLEKISSGAAYERKYSNDHIRLIENAIRRPGESRLYSEILFDEWGSSGRKHERPTLGVLLHLLIQSKLYRAADFVAELLNEPKPSRPKSGPAAEFEFEADVFQDIKDVVNDSRFYPNTSDLQENINNDINNDFYTKYQMVDKKMPTINENSEHQMMTPPKPPPRLLKSARLLKQQQKEQEIVQQQQTNHTLQQTANKNSLNSQNYNESSNQQSLLNTQSNNENTPVLSLSSLNNIPKLSALLNSSNNQENNTTEIENLLPNLSALNDISVSTTKIDDDKDKISSVSSTPSLIYTEPIIVECSGDKNPELSSIPLVVLSKSLDTESRIEGLRSDDAGTQELPAISALNLNYEKGNIEENQQQQENILENVSFEALNVIPHKSECADQNSSNANIPILLENFNYNRSSSNYQQNSFEESYNGIDHRNDIEFELDDDEDSIPNLSFLENRSSNNESSLTSVTNTSGENSFEQSVNDCSSASTDNVPFLSVLNQ